MAEQNTPVTPGGHFDERFYDVRERVSRVEEKLNNCATRLYVFTVVITGIVIAMGLLGGVATILRYLANSGGP